LQYGSTYNGHPVALASAYAVVKYMLQHRVIEHAAAMQTHMEVRPRKPSVLFFTGKVQTALLLWQHVSCPVSLAKGAAMATVPCRLG
jgi:hypothetical protein